MVIKTASPGVYIQELDLTRGILDPVTRNNGLLAGPFERGPVDFPVKVSTEVEFRQIFGGPTDENYEYWYTVDNFLEYGGQCYVIRCDDSQGDYIDASIEYTDGSNVTSNVRHPQKMRNATDAFLYNPTDFNEPTQSYVYLKNDDEYDSYAGAVIPNYGTFFARNPGTWMNGVGVAVIDSGADYQMTLSVGNPALNVDALLIVNGGSADQEYTDVLVGGDAAQAEIDPLMNLEVDTGYRAFNPDTIVGTRLVQYVKISSSVTNPNTRVVSTGVNASEVTDIDLIHQGAGFKSNVSETLGQATGWVTDVRCTAEPRADVTDSDPLGEGMIVDLYIEDGVVTAHRINLRGSSAPRGFKVGDVFYTDDPNVEYLEAAKFTVEDTRDINGLVVRIGDDATGVIGVLMREENGYYVVAVAAHADGTFGTAQKGDAISDPAIAGSVIGVVDEYVVLGYYTFYGSSRERLVDVIWEPQMYTREEGMGWLWPNRPYGGELVFSNKVATNVNGVPVELPGSTEQEPIYQKLEGPAKVTPSSGDTIHWSSIRERWVQTYVPRRDDIIFDTYVNSNDPNAIVTPFSILAADDWYSQQIAFEGIPWIQFAPRPRTSSHAQEMNCENDEMNIIVYDAEGSHDTTAGAAPQKGRVLETYYQCSKLRGALTVEGSNNYYQDLINTGSQIIFANEQVKIIGSTSSYALLEDGSIHPQNTSINAGKALPGTLISTGLDCAYLQPRFGTVYKENLDGISTRNKVTSIKEVKIDSMGSGWDGDNPDGVGRTLENVLAISLDDTNKDLSQEDGNGNYIFRVSVTTNGNGGVQAVSITDNDLNVNFSYGERIALTHELQTSDGEPVLISVTKLADIVRAPYLLLGGHDQLTSSLGELQAGYRKALTDNLGDLDYLLQGPAYDNGFFAELATENGIPTRTTDQLSQSISKANALIAIADELKTAMVCLSPPKSLALDPIESGRITEGIVEWADRVASSSYAVMDSGYKRMYDRFREKYVYVPLNADVAGCMVRTSLVSQPFFSPGGMQRGQIKNVERLSYDPSKPQRDTLYSHRVNPIVTWPGEGTVLYGDKTTLAYSSAFQRINVRRLFIYCERIIAQFAREVLFEFNDVPTRLNFVNTVSPFLTDVVSKRGATDFLVVCDASNNPPDVIDRNEFVADIYIKPNRSINFVQLTFVATKTGVSFSEAIGSTRLTGN